MNCTNIGYSEINQLILRKEELQYSRRLIINFSRHKDLKFYGEIDPVFYSYLILFFSDIKDLYVEFNFLDDIDSDRFFSLSSQIAHIKYLYKKFIPKKNFIVKGDFVNKESGEVKSITFGKIMASKSFIPALYITEKTYLKFFKNPINRSDILSFKYFERLDKEIKKILGKTVDVKLFQSYKLRFRDLSFVKICILNLLIYKANKKFKKLNINRKENIEYNKKLIENFLSFVDNLSKGLEELALNIVQHSTYRKGIITVRNFDKERLLAIKPVDERNYLKNISQDSFIDINVIDLGNEDIQSNYIENLRQSKKRIINEFENQYNAPKEEVNILLRDSLKITFDEDIEMISNHGFEFHNLFLSGPESVNNLSIQKNKLITKIGLQYFTRLVKDKYKGFIKISSKDKKTILYNIKDSTNSNIFNSEGFVQYGTYYSCLIPIDLWKENEATKVIESHSQSTNTNTFNELESFNKCKIESNLKIISNYIDGDKNIIFYEPHFRNNSKSSKYDDFIHFHVLLNQLNTNKKTDVIAISCKEIEKENIVNPSHWLRFIWTLNSYYQNVILYDIDFDQFKSIIDLRKMFHLTNSKQDRSDFWDENSRVLFFSRKLGKFYEGDSNEYFRYGANILAGNNQEDFNYINTKIWTHHYSHKKGIFDIRKISYANKSSSHFNSVLFNNGKNLHYFEVLLTTSTENEDNISLFEKSVQYSLNTLLIDKRIENTNNKGYKIANTHFRLGSKIHISDFYYAKKLFQNSFFTTPLSYLIAEDIWKRSMEVTSIYDQLRISLVGYENYSSFLVSSIRNFLVKKINNYNRKASILINHFTISKDGTLSREKHKLLDKVIIIVPIASTFSTSLKIEDQLHDIVEQSKFNGEGHYTGEFKIEVLNPVYNVVLVAHRPEGKKFVEGYVNESNKFPEYVNEAKNIYFQSNWKKIDKNKKEVIVSRYNSLNSNTEDKQDKIQKYLIPVYTVWNKAEDCKLCYSHNPFFEKCLIETGSASITPQLIFGFPKTKPFNSVISDSYHKGLSLEGSLLYGNLKTSNNKYLYYNRTGKIIKDNRDEIIEWIKQLKSILLSKYKEDFIDKKVVIVTPNTESRSNFLDLVNEYLFDYSANCIIISLNEDYIENSETLYSDGLHKANTVIYVDDVLSTSKSFLETNFILKYIRDKNSSGEGIDYCIAMINRMSYSDEENLLLKLKPLNKVESIKRTKNRLICYEKIYNPTIEEANTKFPIDIEREKYRFLHRNSSLDAVREIFYKKRRNLRRNDLAKSPSFRIKDYSLNLKRESKRRNKKLYQLLILKSIYSLFEYDFNFEINLKENDSSRIERYEIEKRKYSEKVLEKLHSFFPKINSKFLLNEEGKEEIKKSIDNLIQTLRNKLGTDLKHRHIIRQYDENIEFVVLKVICSTPLIYYKEIRETAFYWVLIKLETTLIKFKRIIENNPIDVFKIKGSKRFSLYQDLKFLLRKSIRLKSNFIFHPSFLEQLKHIITALMNIKSLDVQVCKANNESFKKTLLKLLAKKEYLRIPLVKLNLYDFCQNCLKDKIFSSITFEDGVDLKLEEEDVNLKSYHKKLIQEYNEYRSQILINPEYKDLLTPVYSIVSKEDLNHYKRFESEFKNIMLMSTYNLSTSKRFVYYVVSLIQELVYQHETKSIRVDKILDELQSNRNSNRNGTYGHLLRLLRLENTEILNKYSKHLISLVRKTEIVDYNFFDQQGGNLKLMQLADIQDELEDSNIEELKESSLNQFLQLKGIIRDFSKRESRLENIQIIVRLFIDKLKGIVNGGGREIVDNIYFTINYKNIEEYKQEDLYTFSLLDNQDELEIVQSNNSLTAYMGKGEFYSQDSDFKIENNNSKKKVISNLEIMKNSSGTISCREKIGITKSNINKNVQFNSLGNDKSILLIRISKFDSKNKQNPFYKGLMTQGVLTFYLDGADRLKEKKLRLLLALRQDFSDFLNKKASGTTFLELLRSYEEQRLIENSTHYLSKFHRAIHENIDKLSKVSDVNVDDKGKQEKASLKEKIKLELLLAVNCVFAQINSIDEEKIHILKTENISYLRDFITLLFDSHYFEGDTFQITIEDFDFKTFEDESITLYYPIWYIIIPQIILNIKRYTLNIKNQVKIYYKSGYIYFDNKVHKASVNNSNSAIRKKQGIELCKRLIKKIYNLKDEKEIQTYIKFGPINNKESFRVKLKLL